MRKFNEAAGMPVPASVKAGKLLSWRTAAKTDKILSRSKNVGINCCRSEKNSYLCDALHNEWRVRSLNSEHFLCLQNCCNIAALYPRVEKLMLSLPFIGVVQRERQSRFSLPVTSLSTTMMKSKKLISWQTAARIYKALSMGLVDKVTEEEAKEYTKYLSFFWSLIAISGWMEGGML